MIIGIDASRANRTHKTGTEWYAYYLIREFAQIDSENQYILYTDKALDGGLYDLGKNHTEDQKNNYQVEFDVEGFQKLKSPHNNFKAKILKWPFKYFWTLGGLSKEMLLARPDVLFIPSHVLPIIHQKKSIVTIHDIGFIKDSTLFGRDDIGSDTLNVRTIINFLVKIFTFGRYGANSFDYLLWSTRYALKNAAKIISISHFTKMELSDWCKFDKRKINVVYNGYPVEIFKRITDKELIRNKLKEFDINDPYFFYIGRLEKKKNIVNLVEAYAILRDKYPEIKQKLVLVGDASYGFDEIKYMTREFDIVDDVIMPGWIREDLIPYFYSGADAFVFPSKYEGFGIPLLQAMACGTPIAASRVSSIPEVAGEAAAYFYPDYSLSIAETMYKIISDKKYASDLVEKGFERVKMFSWEKCARETHKVITEW